MLDITTIIPGKHKRTASGWISFNAVCCDHNGERADKRQRGGIKQSGDDWSYHCFNCGYKASFKLGRTLSYKARKLLNWFGVDSNSISAINLESLKHKDLAEMVEARQEINVTVSFDKKELPAELRLVTVSDSEQIEYLRNRGIEWDSYPFMISPEAKGRNSNRIVVPYTYEGSVVGWSARYLDKRLPKYINEQQPGYVFGIDLQQDHWTQLIVVEGLFDAVSINGVAVLHNTVNDQQAQIIKQQHKQVTVVPDQDDAGLKLIDRAVELGWAVSIPDWPEHIKDVNDAVKHYGKLGTLITIMNSRETSKIKIEMAKRRLVKRVKKNI
jgi:hypothetical protein